MYRLFVALVLVALAVPANAQAQYGGPRMSSQEARVIADYWVRSYLRRAPTPIEEQQLQSQLLRSPPGHVLAGLLTSDEYFRKSGGDQPSWLGQLFADVGHREPSRYEIDARLQRTDNYSPRAIASEFLHEHPKNWWPGPAATPPRELQYFYQSPYNGHAPHYGWN